MFLRPGRTPRSFGRGALLKAKHCDTCRHGPNPKGRVFSKDGERGCLRMDKTEKVFDSLGDDLQSLALQMSAAIVGYLDSRWKGKRRNSCPGWQSGSTGRGNEKKNW